MERINGGRMDRPVPTDDLDYVLSRSGDLWRQLSGSRLFITGGTGFFGRWLLESLRAANSRLGVAVETVILTRNSGRFAARFPWLAQTPGVSFIDGDVRSFEFPSGEFRYVIHAATEASAALIRENPLQMLDTIVGGTQRVLEFTGRCGAKSVLLTSSGAVYGSQPPEMTHIPEAYLGGPDPCDSRSCYGEGKRLAELLCVSYAQAHGFQAKIARCFAFVGPYLPQDTHFAVGNFIRDAVAGSEIVVQGDGTPYRSYLHAADLVIWLLTVLLHGKSCRPYNVGSDEGLTIAELAKTVAREAGGVNVRILGKPVPGKPASRYVPSVQRAREELGLDIGIGLSDALRRTIAWSRMDSAQ